LEDPLAHPVDGIETDGERGAGRAGGIDPPPRPHRLAQALTHQIVQRRRQGCPRRAVLRDQLGEPGFRRFEVEWVLGKMGLQLLERSEDRVGCLPSRYYGETADTALAALEEREPHRPKHACDLAAAEARH